MSNFANWILPELLRTLGWTLLHFLWQGAGLAALFAVGAAVCRSAAARYALAVGALVLMMVSPVITFTWLRTQMNPAVQTGAQGASTWAGTSTQNATALSGSRARAAGPPPPARRIPNGAADGHAVAGGSVVPGRPATEPENRGRIVSDRKNAAQRDQAGGRRTVRKMRGAATEDGSRPRHPVLRVPSAGRSSGAGMVPSRGAAAGEGANRLDRRANRRGHRA